jgi:hypothetical protein
METYELLTGEVLNIFGLADAERAFLKRLSDEADRGADYFDLLRLVKGPEALPLRGGPITPAIAASVLYRAAHDIADRVGIKQGYLLAPDVARSVEAAPDLLSLTETAELIGITRPATHQALLEARLSGQRVGNAWVVRRADAEAFKRARSSRAGDSTRGDVRRAGGSRE